MDALTLLYYIAVFCNASCREQAETPTARSNGEGWKHYRIELDVANYVESGKDSMERVLARSQIVLGMP